MISIVLNVASGNATNIVNNEVPIKIPIADRKFSLSSGFRLGLALCSQVIASILQASVEQIAIAEAPKILDPIQQTVSTTIRGYIHNAFVSRKEVLTAIQRLGAPLPGVYLKILRKAYETFLFNKDINELLVAVNAIGGDAPASETENVEQSASKGRKALLKRDDLKLICFEYVWH
jgi:hypothetical protein